MHYYQHHIGDFIKSTANLTHEERSIYLQLIWIYYDTENPLTEDVESLAFDVGARDKTELIKTLLKRYFIYDPHLKSYTHHRIDKELSLYKSKADSARRANKSRWSEKTLKSDMKSETNHIRKVSESYPNQEPRTKNQEPLKDIAVSVNTLPAVKVKKIGFDYKEKKWVGLDDNKEQIKLWSEIYPDIDLRTEFLEMKGWLTTNAQKTNFPKFINNWLKKSQDKVSKPNNKTFAQQTQEYKDDQAAKFYKPLLEADQETLKKWGLA